MSIERAVKFCKLCHGYNRTVKANSIEFDRSIDPKIHQRIIDYSNLRDNATSEAMKSLEEYKRIDDTMENIVKCNISLKACRDCDYKSAKIAELNTKDKKEEN